MTLRGEVGDLIVYTRITFMEFSYGVQARGNDWRWIRYESLKTLNYFRGYFSPREGLMPRLQNPNCAYLSCREIVTADNSPQGESSAPDTTVPGASRRRSPPLQVSGGESSASDNSPRGESSASDNSPGASRRRCSHSGPMFPGRHRA